MLLALWLEGLLWRHSRVLRKTDGAASLYRGSPIVRQSACKPGSVPLTGCLSFIYARCHHIAKAFYPPAWASNPQTPVYMNLQPPRRTARTSLHDRWALTPPSHPYPCGRLFSSALLHLRRWLSVRKWNALCCPDFPPLPCGNGDRPSDCLLCVLRKRFGRAVLLCITRRVCLGFRLSMAKVMQSCVICKCLFLSLFCGVKLF